MAGVKSRQSGDMEVIIQKSSMCLQYVLPGSGEVDVATDRLVEVRIGGGL